MITWVIVLMKIMDECLSVSCSISEVVNDLKESSKHAKYLENISAKQVVHFFTVNVLNKQFIEPFKS